MTIFDEPVLVKIVVSILVQRLGGDVHITQADIDAIAYNRLLEDVDVEEIQLRIEMRKAQA